MNNFLFIFINSYYTHLCLYSPVHNTYVQPSTLTFMYMYILPLCWYGFSNERYKIASFISNIGKRKTGSFISHCIKYYARLNKEFIVLYSNIGDWSTINEQLICSQFLVLMMFWRTKMYNLYVLLQYIHMVNF